MNTILPQNIKYFANSQIILYIQGYAKMDEAQKKNKIPQILNHFEDNRGICTKTGLIRSLKQYYQTNDDSCVK